MAIGSWMPKKTPLNAPPSDPYSGYGQGGGGNGRQAMGMMSYAGGGVINNPWEKAMKDNYAAAKEDKYGSQWDLAVAQAMKMGNRDYEGDLKRYANEEVTRQQTSADNQLGSMGMRELALRGDVQDQRTKHRNDATQQAVIQSQGIKASALEAMRGMLGSASGAQLDRIGAMINAANSGAGNYLDFNRLAIPLQEKLGAANGQNFRPSPALGGGMTREQVAQRWRDHLKQFFAPTPAKPLDPFVTRR